MSKHYRIAIVGVGGISTMHAKAIGDLPNAEVVAGSCRTKEKGEKFASEFNCKWFADYTEMLDEAKPDIISICTPSGAHLEPTQAAAKRGIHVICEKPLEITTKRVDELAKACAEGGVRLGGIFPQRYNPVVRAIYDAAKAGRFGNLSVVNSYCPWWRDDAYYSPDRWQGTLALDGGGAMMNQSIHGVDAVQWLAAATMPDLKPDENPVEEVFAYTAKRGHDPNLIEVEDTAVGVLKFRNGALGQLLGTTSMYPGTHKRIQMGGRDGTAEIREDQLMTFEFREAKDSDKATLDEYGKESEAGGASDPLAISYDGHTRNIGAFLESLESDKPFMLDATEARKAVAIIEALYESAKTGKPAQPK